MSGRRSAEHTINGYKYQFDYSILCIANAKDGSATITLEGIEDVDYWNEVVQCKYHQSRKYTTSVIKKPILEFLRHFSSSSAPPTYTLYAHFGEGELPDSLSLDDVRALMNDDADLNRVLTDAQLTQFLASHLKLRRGAHIDRQLEEVKTALCRRLSCEMPDCEMYFYGNALTEVIDLSRRPTEQERTTTPSRFFAKVNRRQALLTTWLQRALEQADFVTYCRAQLARRSSFLQARRRFIVLSSGLCEKWPPQETARVIETSVHDHYQMGASLDNAVPLTFVLDGTLEYVKRVKEFVLSFQIPINDGYEHISFSAYHFDEPPVTNRVQRRGGKASSILERSSYHVRIISKTTYQAHKKKLFPPETVIDATDDGVQTIEPVEEADCFLFASVPGSEFLVDLLRK